MKNKLFKRLWSVLALLVLGVSMLCCSSCSYLVYKIYMNAYEKKVIEEEIVRRGNKDKGEDKEGIEREVYYNSISDGEVAGYHIFTLVDAKTYTLAAYEYTTPPGEEAYSSMIFHMRGEYARTGNVVTIKPGISMYAYSDTSSNHKFFVGETEAERKKIYESFTGGSDYNIALQSDGTFYVGGQADSAKNATGVKGTKIYQYYDDSTRISIKTLTIFSDDTYVITTTSTHSTIHKQPVSTFIAHGTLSYKEELSTKEYNIVEIKDGSGVCYVSNNGSPMWNECIRDALHSNWWDLSVGERSFYVTDKGFTYQKGLIDIEIPAQGLYGDTQKGEEPTFDSV